MTFSSIPGTSDLLKQARMPFAVLVQPLAPTHPEEEPLQVVVSTLMYTTLVTVHRFQYTALITVHRFQSIAHVHKGRPGGLGWQAVKMQSNPYVKGVPSKSLYIFCNAPKLRGESHSFTSESLVGRRHGS